MHYLRDHWLGLVIVGLILFQQLRLTRLAQQIRTDLAGIIQDSIDRKDRELHAKALVVAETVLGLKD